MSFVKKGYIDIFVSGILWGSLGIFVTSLSSNHIPPSISAFIRLFMGAICIAFFMLIKNGISFFKIDGKGIGLCAILGILGQGMFNYCYNSAISNSGIATASVLLYTAPVFVCLMARLLFKEKIGNSKKLALLINIIGCVLTVTGGNFLSIHFSVIGVVLGVAAGFFYGLMTIISKVLLDKYNSFTVLFYSFVFGSAFLFISVKPMDIIIDALNIQIVFVAILYGLIPTVFSYLLYMRGLSKKPETSMVPIIASIETVTAAIIGFSVFHEKFSLFKILGIIYILASIVLMNIQFDFGFIRQDVQNRRTCSEGKE